jgi:predicted ATPase
VIATPDQRLRVFVSSTLEELVEERAAARDAIESLRLTPVMFELGARAHPPRELYTAYLTQSDVFVGIYGERYGWLAPDRTISGLEEEYRLAAEKPRLLYVKRPAPSRDARLTALVEGIEAEGAISYRTFTDADELRRLLADDLAVLLSERFQSERRAPAAETAAGQNLPAPLTSLVGREGELEAIAELLRDSRLVTLAGPGGVGKTRLAIELARGQLESRADGVWFVDLAPKPETPDVAAETARVLDVQTRAGTTATEALRRYLARRDLLIVLDNCEQVVDACAELAAALLSSCPEVRILATSREPLGIEGETVWRLEPLAPEDAYRLFLLRARQRQADFQPDADTRATIAEVCERLDRLPLAIELAAARASVMAPQEILAGLAERLGELGGERRLSPSHHRSVRAAVEWSYQLLDPVEQEAFRALAVFVGGFDAAAARAVAPQLSLDLLGRLVDKSLVAVAETTQGRTRYRLLETMREYAEELLDEAAELDEARERHLRHFAALTELPEMGWPSARAQESVGKVAADYENVRAALEWAAASDPCGARPLLAAARDVFFMVGATDGRRLAHLLLERCPVRDRDRVEIQIVAGVLAFIVADAEAARRVLVEAEELGAELGERGLEGWVHYFLGLTETLDGQLEPAREHLEATRALHDESGAASGWRRATAVLGLNFLIANEPHRARDLVEQALAANVAEDDEWGQGQCNVYLGLIAEATGADAEVVTSYYRRAASFLRPFRGGPLLPAVLIGQAGVLVRDDPARALRAVAAAYALNERTGNEFSRVYRERAERVRASAEAAVGADAGKAWAEGERLGMDEAIALAFGEHVPGTSREAVMT